MNSEGKLSTLWILISISHINILVSNATQVKACFATVMANVANVWEALGVVVT